jgi:hypothetical protein
MLSGLGSSRWRLGKAIQIGKVLEGALGGTEHLHLTNVTGTALKLCLFAESGQGIDLDSVTLVLAVYPPPATQLAGLGVPACRSPLVPANDAGGTDRGGEIEGTPNANWLDATLPK